MNMHANIAAETAAPFHSVHAGLTYQNVFWRADRLLETMRRKIDAKSDRIDQIAAAFRTSGTDDIREWEAAFADFEKYRRQFQRMHDFHLRLAIAVARQGAPA